MRPVFAVKPAVGERFGRWTVIKVDGVEFGDVICKCDCGQVRDVQPSNLRWGLTRSCGCLRRELCSKNLNWARQRRLTPADVLAIRASDETAISLGKKLGISAQAVGLVRRRQTYRHVT